MSTEQALEEVLDPFKDPDGPRRTAHHATWRFFEAGDDTIAICGAPLRGKLRRDSPGWHEQCGACLEIARELRAQGYTYRPGRYQG